MPDTLTKKQRSYCMSRIRSRWTTQEKILHNFLKGNKIKHKMHPELTGNPDILLIESKTAIFLQGCFWHKCPKCFKKPKTNKKYWLPKIENNIKRDKINEKTLKKQGYKVLKIWEHDIKNSEKWISKIEKFI